MDTAFRAEIVTNLLGLKDYMFSFQKICLGIVHCVFSNHSCETSIEFSFSLSSFWNMIVNPQECMRRNAPDWRRYPSVAGDDGCSQHDGPPDDDCVVEHRGGGGITWQCIWDSAFRVLHRAA